MKIRINLFANSNYNLKIIMSVLSKRDKSRILRVLVIQIALGFLDLIGVAAIGALGALAVKGIQSQAPGDRVSMFLRFAQIENLTFQNQVIAIALFATFILLTRTILSIYFSRKILRFLSQRSARLSVELFRKYLYLPFGKVQELSGQQIVFALTQGVTSLMMGVLAVATSLVADISLLAIMSVGLVLLDPIMAISTFFGFGLVGALLYFLLHERALEIGKRETQFSIQTSATVVRIANSYKENFVKSNRWRFIREVQMQRTEAALLQAELAFMPYISKYAIEFTVVLGALFLGAIQFTLTDATNAVAVLSVFLAAGTRIAPAVMRVQQGLVQIKSALGASQPTLDLIQAIAVYEFEEYTEHSRYSSDELVPDLKLSKLTFEYPENSNFKLGPIDLTVPAGDRLAVVGVSGSGKSTLVDLIIGLQQPTAGTILISGMEPRKAIRNWPGKFAYVPQDAMIFEGSISSNVCLGYREDEIDEERVWNALDKAQLKEFVSNLPDGLNTQVGERGSKLSGGQRQRLGIARALYSSPKVLILDEATSALDGLIESEITNAVDALKADVTVVIIAHRLSTIKDFKQILYLDKGSPACIGDFSTLRANQPEFDKQAKLMGL
jgi:ABC-type multidrug transport system fused ATPase/permease subunit